MKYKKIPQSVYIEGIDGFETSALFNEKMRQLAHLNPTYERDGKSFWIFYYIVEKEPETLAEKFEEEGKKAHCMDCKKCIRELNRFGEVHGVKKYATCGRTGECVRIDSSACDDYYRELMSERGDE
jgi:hypothetical protein